MRSMAVFCAAIILTIVAVDVVSGRIDAQTFMNALCIMVLIGIAASEGAA